MLVHDMILDGNDVVGFLNGRCPPASLNIKALEDDGSTTNYFAVENSCYHICHKSAVSKGAAITLSRKPLAPVNEIVSSALSALSR